MENIFFLAVGLILFCAFVVAVAYYVPPIERRTKEQKINEELASYGKFKTDKCQTKIGDYAKYFDNESNYKGWK